MIGARIDDELDRWAFGLRSGHTPITLAVDQLAAGIGGRPVIALPDHNQGRDGHRSLHLDADGIERDGRAKKHTQIVSSPAEGRRERTNATIPCVGPFETAGLFSPRRSSDQRRPARTCAGIWVSHANAGFRAGVCYSTKHEIHLLCDNLGSRSGVWRICRER